MSGQPYPKPGFRRGAGRSEVSYLALHRMGFSMPPGLLQERWAFTPPFHPYRKAVKPAGGLFSVARSVVEGFRPSLPRVSSVRLRGILPCGVRTFLPRKGDPPPWREPAVEC